MRHRRHHHRCTDGTATTTGNLPLGGYTVVISVIDAQNNVLGQSSPVTTSLDFGNQLRGLGNFEFDFTP